MEEKNSQNRQDLFKNRSSSKEFLLSKAELRPWRKTKKKKEDGEKDIVNKLFPGTQSGEAFIEHAMKILSSYLAFGAIVIRVDNMNEGEDSQKPGDIEDSRRRADGESSPHGKSSVFNLLANPAASSGECARVSVQKMLGDTVKAIDYICKTGNGFWGRMDRFLFGCYLPDKNASSCLKLAVKLKKSLESLGEGTVTTGIAAYPAFSYRKQDIIANAGKALDHADYFGPGSIVAFDAVSLNISGDKLYHDGDIEGAIKEFKMALLFDPDDVNVHNSLGVCYGVLEDFQKAIREFKECIRLSPKEVMPLYNAGLIYQLTGKKEKALKNFQKAGKLEEELFEIDFQTGKLFLELGKPEEGREYLEKALKLKPESSVALFHLGESFVATGLMDEAEASYEKAIKINPNDAASLSSLGWLYNQKDKNRDVALAFCRQSVEIDPGNGLFRQRLGRLYMKLGLPEEALRELKKAEKLNCESCHYIQMIQSGKYEE
ncbi:MAG: tetratricopeptide repeat protein [Desulfobacteraceae bacterium]|nr:MAG: tetratricopeptide repeat protein [Desulfobacteraceae bacterium]